MEFGPHNNIVKLCLQGMALEETGNRVEARRLFNRAMNEATDDFEKFQVTYFIARNETDLHKKISAFETSLRYASATNDLSAQGVLYTVHENIAGCYEELNDIDEAKRHHELAASFKNKISDMGPFYHGTKADLKRGDLLTPGFISNYDTQITMNHIYFTAIQNGAGLAAELAGIDGQPRVYMVEPTGNFEHDPNVTDKKFPGNPTRSYRSSAPLKITGEVFDFTRLTREQLQQWRERLANTKGEIIN